MQGESSSNRQRLKRAGSVLLTVAFILLMAACGVALLLLGRQFQSPWASGLSTIPFAVALFTLATLLRVGPWFLNALKLVFPQLAAAIDAQLAEKHAQWKIESILGRLKVYLSENDLPYWPHDTPKLVRRIARATSGRLGPQEEGWADHVLLDALLQIVDDARVASYPTLPDIDRLMALEREVFERHPPEDGQSSISNTQVLERACEGLCLIGLAVFIVKFAYELLPLRRLICQRMARNREAVLMALAYLELKEERENTKDPGGKDFVMLSELAEQWVNVLEQRHALREGFRHEVDTLREALGDGHWISHLWQLLQRVITRLQVQLQNLNQLKDTHPGLLQSLRRVFGSLDLDTIERFLEARTIDAYLLTFNNPQGRLAALIDSLVSPECRQNVEALGITLETGKAPKYLLKNYTPRARIGVVPRGWSFKSFHDAFASDLDLLIANRNKLPCYTAKPSKPLADIEVVLQRFGLRDHYSYPPESSDLRSRKATLNIRELLADVLEEDDLVAVIAYEHNKKRIVDLLLDGPIIELVGGTSVVAPHELDVAEVAEVDLLLKIDMLHDLNLLPRNVKDSESVNWGIRKLAQALPDDQNLGRRAVATLTESLCNQVASLAPPASAAPSASGNGGTQPTPQQLHTMRHKIAAGYVHTLEAIGALYPREEADNGQAVDTVAEGAIHQQGR